MIEVAGHPQHGAAHHAAHPHRGCRDRRKRARHPRKPTAQPRRKPLPATLPSITQLGTQRAGRALGSLLQPRRKTCTSLSRRSLEPRPSIPNRAANLIHPFLACLHTPLTQPLHRRGHRRIQRLGNFERHRLHRAGKPGHKRRPSPPTGGRRDPLRLLKRPFHAALHNTLCARRLLSEPRDKTRAATPTRPARHLREPGELPLGSAGGPIQLPHPRPRIRIQHDRELF